MSYSQFSSMTSIEYVISFLLGILLAFDLYTLPFILWRFCRHSAPYNPKKARWIAIIYCAAAWLTIRIIEFLIYGKMNSGAAVLLWGPIGYGALRAGWEEQNEELGGDREIKDVSLYDECVRYISSKLTDFNIVSYATIKSGKQTDFMKIIHDTMVSISADKTVKNNDPSIVMLSNNVMVRSCLRFLQMQVNGELPHLRRESRKVSKLLNDCLKWCSENNIISPEKCKHISEKAKDMLIVITLR